jgi:hypothetical protein
MEFFIMSRTIYFEHFFLLLMQTKKIDSFSFQLIEQ